MVVSVASLPRSGKPSRRPANGEASTSSTATPAIAATHGRRWTARPQRAAGAASGSPAARRVPGIRSRSIRVPAIAISAGTSVTEAAITINTDHDRRERGAVEVGEAHQEQAEQRDHHGRPGDQHRAPGGGDRLRDRLLRRPPGRQRGAVARDDQQRVVDPDADAEHRRERGRPVRDVEHSREQPDQRRRDPQTEQRGRERQARRDDRSDASSSTSVAIARPTISDEISPSCALAISWPPSSTRSPAPLASLGELPSAARRMPSGSRRGAPSAGSAARRCCRRGRFRRRRRRCRGRCPRARPRRRRAGRSAPVARGGAGAVLRLPDHVDGVGVALGEAVLQQLGGGARVGAGRRVVVVPSQVVQLA